MKKNPFKKRTIAYYFYDIDTFFQKPSVKTTGTIFKEVINIIVIIIKGIWDIVFYLSIGLIIASFFGS